MARNSRFVQVTNAEKLFALCVLDVVEECFNNIILGINRESDKVLGNYLGSRQARCELVH
jgi:hypothetical protein